MGRHDPSHADIPQVHRRPASDDPVGGHLAGTAGGLDADGVEPGGHEHAVDVGGFAEQVAIIWSERLGAVEEQPDARFGKQRGYTENISTRRPWRKRGLASALMTRSLRLQRDLGLTESALGVDSENPSGAVPIYEKMAFRVVKRFTAYRKPLPGS